MDIIKEIESEHLGKLAAERPVPDFGPGDTLRVSVKVVEGARERVQAFEGVCIARKNAGLNSAFTVRKISYGEGVERVFPLYSPAIASIEVIRRGDVRRAKLYYLRGRTGKRARIAEKTDWATGRAAGTAPEEAGEAAAAGPETAAAPEPKKKKRKKKHDIEVPETGEAPPDIAAGDAAPEAEAPEATDAEAEAGAKPAKKAKKADKDNDDKAPKKKAAKKDEKKAAKEDK